MLTFKPISYGDNDLRAFKYGGTTSVREGTLCYVSTVSTSLNQITATPYSGTAPATLRSSTATAVYDRKKYFPIYREDPNVESIAATIAQNTDVIGFAMVAGNEFEIHKSVTESGYATSWAKGTKVCLGSTGKFAAAAGKNDTKLVLGECTGTFNAAWIRVRVT